MEKFYGVDVSEYQSAIDWDKVRRAGKRFAMLRCGCGRYDSQADRRFEENYRGATGAGLDVGAYLFSCAVTAAQAHAEAENCLRRIEGKRFGCPIVLDVETPAQRALGREKLSALVQVFCGAIEDAGCYAAIYADKDMLERCLSAQVRTRYDVWLAHWAKKPDYDGSFGMWQYSATGIVDGIRGRVDLDVAYKDYPAVMRRCHLNGF